MVKISLPSGLEIDTSDGSVVEQSDASVNCLAEVDDNVTIDPSDLVPARRKMINELPAEPKVINVCAIIYVYTTLGLSDLDISEILKVPIDRIEEVRSSAAYTDMSLELISCYERAVQNEIKGKFIHASGKAAKKIIDTVGSKSEDNALNASKHVLGMAGLTPATVVEHKVSMEDELVIRIVEADRAPVIDVDVSDGL